MGPKNLHFNKYPVNADAAGPRDTGSPYSAVFPVCPFFMLPQYFVYTVIVVLYYIFKT